MKYIMIVNGKFYAGNLQFSSNFSMAKELSANAVRDIRGRLKSSDNVIVTIVVKYLKSRGDKIHELFSRTT